jgi:hypothetical protein
MLRFGEGGVAKIDILIEYVETGNCPSQQLPVSTIARIYAIASRNLIFLLSAQFYILINL